MGGRKMVTVNCPFCEGEGQHPMNFDQPCPVCRGAGRFTVYEPYSQCQHCDGSGKKFATIDELCSACRGRGVIQL
jgi:DnaJ-class molecular chaperone